MYSDYSIEHENKINEILDTGIDQIKYRYILFNSDLRLEISRIE